MRYHIEHSTIQENVRIRRKRVLPLPGTVLVEVGQSVTAEQVVARSTGALPVQTIDVSDRLGVDPEKVAALLSLSEGDRVAKGDVLARKKAFLGLGKTVESPCNGQVEAIWNGFVIIRPDGDPFDLRAAMKAKVVSVLTGRGVELEISGSYLSAIWSSGVDTWGTLQVAGSDRTTVLKSEMITASSHGRIIASGHLSDGETLDKAERSGIKGLILGSISAEIAARASELSMTMVVTGGIGTQALSAPVFEILKRRDGGAATVLTTTTTGGRCEVLLPSDGPIQLSPPGSVPEPLREGSRVIVVREPLAGESGTIKRIIGSSVSGRSGSAQAELVLDDGAVWTLPITNLETYG